MEAPKPPLTTESRLMVLMFTDLVGSTALKEKVGARAYGDMFRRHDELLAQALASARGEILQDNGDGYFIVFESPRRAVRAALLFQWLMKNEPWKELFATRVGLHLGEVDQSVSQAHNQPKFFGSAIDVASRVMSLATGGQILMTRMVYESARIDLREHPPLPNGAPAPALKWASHGAYLLKGAADPVEVYEVGAEGMAPLAPPPDSEKAKRTAVPLTPPSKSPSRRGLLIGAAAVLGAGGLGVGLWALLRNTDPLVDMRRREIEREVAAALAEQPLLIKDHVVQATTVDTITSSSNDGFQIITDHRTVDMRAWKEVPSDKMADFYSAVSTIRRVRLKKLAEKRFEMDSRTSGLDVFPRGLDAYPYDVQVLRSEQYVGNERMKVRKISVDVGNVPIGAEVLIRTASTAWNSCQTEQEQWFGLIGYKESFNVSMLVLFPPNKPFKSYSFSIAPTSKAPPKDYDGAKTAIAGPAKDWIWWEIPSPLADHVYRLHWKW
jgi:class 3 adenylate cyclase